MIFSRLKRQAIAVAAAGAVLAGMPLIAHATYSGTNDVLVYMKGAGMTQSLGASSLSGGAVTISLAAKNTPRFSPDGSKAVWFEQGGSTWLFKMANSDGTNVVTVATGSTSQLAYNPSFNPDGTKIIFDYDSDIYEINAAANQTISVSDRIFDSGSGGNASDPQYLNATTIAYLGRSSSHACGSFYPGIYVKTLSSGGSGTLLTNTCSNSGKMAAAFDVSPDGLHVAYRSKPSGGEWGVAITKTDNSGSEIAVFTAPSMSDTSQGRPVFSPDGTKVIYSSTTATKVGTFNGTSVSSLTTVLFPTGVIPPTDLTWAPVSARLSATTTTAPAATTTSTTIAATTTTVPVTTTSLAASKSTSTAPNIFAAATPGVTVTDKKVYTTAPVEVAASSAINVLTATQNKSMDVVTQTPSVCLPNDDELVFINEGKCIAQVVNAKTRAVLRTLKTMVIADDISEVKIGNAVVTLAPIYFDAMSSVINADAIARIRSIKSKVSAAGSVLIIGHSGTVYGNSKANLAISRERARAVLTALRSVGAKGPFAVSGVGSLDPVSRGTTEADQAKNRRVVVALIP